MKYSGFKKFFLTIVLAFTFSCLLAQDKPAMNDTIKVKEPDVIFTRVEVDASYPGGNTAWSKFLIKNLRANIAIDNKAPGGTYMVIVKFVVDKDGSISNIVSETNHGYSMEAEVIRVIKNSGNWNPAYQNGRPVKAYRRQPVTFVVPEESNKKS